MQQHTITSSQESIILYNYVDILIVCNLYTYLSSGIPSPPWLQFPIVRPRILPEGWVVLRNRNFEWPPTSISININIHDKTLTLSY
jgi:hypothetical protein